MTALIPPEPSTLRLVMQASHAPLPQDTPVRPDVLPVREGKSNQPGAHLAGTGVSAAEEPIGLALAGMPGTPDHMRGARTPLLTIRARAPCSPDTDGMQDQSPREMRGRPPDGDDRNNRRADVPIRLPNAALHPSVTTSAHLAPIDFWRFRP